MTPAAFDVFTPEIITLVFGVLCLAFWGAYRLSAPSRALHATRRRERRVERAIRGLERALEKTETRLGEVAREFEDYERVRRLIEMPVEALREAGAKGARFSALTSAGIRTVHDVIANQHRLAQIPGVGAKSVESLVRAATTVKARVDSEPPEAPSLGTASHGVHERLVRSAHRHLIARDLEMSVVDPLRSRVDELRTRLSDVSARGNIVSWVLDPEARQPDGPVVVDARQLTGELDALLEGPEMMALQDAHASLAVEPSAEELARAFRAEASAFHAVFDHALPALARSNAAGGRPGTVARRVEAQNLELRGFKAVLRRYQQFGARFLVHQQRTVLGDEMGLGKTVQALAVMVHFQASGIGRHFIVVAPASIVRNWERECTRHTTLVPFLAYGPEKTAEIGKWIEQGGVAITSYTTLRALDLAATLRDRAIQPTMVVFDEAHFIKNPSARRTQASRDLAAMARHACLMTGTPLENRLEEFRALLEVVDSKIARTSEGVVGGVVVEPSRFQMAIAPVYLRRKVREVLRELPEKLEHEEWVDLDAADRDAYRSALASGNYMAVRRSVTAHGVHTTAKLERLKGLVRMHTEAGRKCLVFSFFLAVLDAVERELDTFGRLTGQVSPDQRSRIVASFERASGPAVLLAQITAGGVGLNLQAASVVILMEPQFKPSTEQQAIARAHRMGQTERVYVHRLLAAESVDERMVELLRGKLDTFRRYADPSLLKEASRESTEARFAQAVIAVERARLGIEGRATINPGEL